jgi:hypothetical protein
MALGTRVDRISQMKKRTQAQNMIFSKFVFVAQFGRFIEDDATSSGISSHVKIVVVVVYVSAVIAESRVAVVVVL